MVGLCYCGYSGQRTFPAYDIAEMLGQRCARLDKPLIR